MKLFTWILSTFLISSSLQAEGFGVDLGPFSLRFGARRDGQIIRLNQMELDPICVAISRKNTVGIITQSQEKISDKEMKIITKQITLEPYLFGTNNRREPILKGKVIDEKMIKEITVKMGEEEAFKNEPNKTNLFGIFQKNPDVSSVNLDRIQRIFIIENSHFDVPKDYDRNSYNDIVDVICEIET